MFDEVTKTEGGKRAARKGAYIFGSTLFQVLFVAVMIVVGARIREAARAQAAVEVKFVRTAPPPPPPPPPAARKKTENKPRTDTPKTLPPPTAMVQPKDVTEEMKPPSPNEPREPEAADEGGVEGGVVGGVAGGIEEAPRYLGAGFRAPRAKDRGCLQSAMRVPPALQGFVSGPITVKFAVRRDGSIGQVQVMSKVPDPRIIEIIARGLAACEWAPGADAQGNPTSIWVIMPIRFAGG